jgi:hypothetical protein
MRQGPESADDEWVARMRELAARDAGELVPRPAFDVYGLAAPELRPIALTDAVRRNDVWEAVGLAYGDWAAPSGPWLTVISLGSAEAASQAELLRVIDSDRNRLADQAGVDEDEPAEPPRYWPTIVRAGARAIRATACQHGTVLAAGLQVGDVSVTVLSRGVDLGTIQLAVVADLEPYLRGQDEMLRQVAEWQRQQPPPILEPAEGMAAFRALVDAELETYAEIFAATQAGRVPRHRAGDAAMTGALWQRAVRELRDRAEMQERQVQDIMTSVINQLMSLGEKASWFTAQPKLRERAIDETLRYAVLGEQVPSTPAQQAWTNSWGYHTNMAVQHGQFADIALRFGKNLIARWLDAWEDWVRRQ